MHVRHDHFIYIHFFHSADCPILRCYHTHSHLFRTPVFFSLLRLICVTQDDSMNFTHTNICILRDAMKWNHSHLLLTAALCIAGHSHSCCHKLQYTYIYRGDTANRRDLLFYSTFLRCIIAPIKAIRIRIKISYIFTFWWICDWYVYTIIAINRNFCLQD